MVKGMVTVWMISLEKKVKRAIEDGTYKQELEKMNFDRFQSIEIQKGIQSHVDVLKYASPEFDAAQMKSIRLALEGWNGC